MRDLINCTIENLIETNPKYSEQSQIGHAMKDEVLPGLVKMAKDKNNQSYKALVQALFESGFLNVGDSDFNLTQLFNYIYGVKIHEALPKALALFDLLEENGFDRYERNSMYNSSGDNYYCAFKFDVKPTESEIKTNLMFGDGNLATRTTERKVIYIENQWPAWAVIIDHCIFTGEPDEVHFVQLKERYNDPDWVPELILQEFDVSSRKKSVFRDSGKSCKLITSLGIREMEAKPVLEPRLIETVLFNIYSGLDSLNIHLSEASGVNPK